MTTTAAIDFEGMLTFLQQSASYPHHPRRVEIRQTHASVVAIVPPYVYKIKKRVDLGFLDFRSLADRKANCEREVRLNSRLCAELYLGVVPITQQPDGGGLAFGAGGEVVDYALQMKQLPDGFFLDELLAKGWVTPSVLEPVLARLKDFYDQQPPDPTLAHHGDIAHLKTNSDENFLTLRQFAGDIIHPVALEAIRQFTEQFYEKRRPLLEKRTRGNRIKDGHGDLRLEHIHAQDGKVCIYDCIEFNDRFRYLDVASDLAFLTMDFDFHHRPDLARHVTERMAGLLNDPEMKQLMDFYQCYRACVRAKVERIRSGEPEVPAAERQQSHERAVRYGQLALRYATLGSVGAVIMVGGRIASGKSTLARQLAQLLGAEYLASDVVRKEGAGLPLYERTPPETKAVLYAAAQKDHVYENLLGAALAGARQGQICLVDATFGRLTNRALFTEAFTREGIPYYFLEAQASEATLRQRLRQRDQQPQVVSDARLDDFDRLNQAYQAPTEIPGAHLLAISTETSPEEGLSACLRQLRAANQDVVSPVG
ncbi:MAG: AAA family ATPase [Ferruginibacter sp.]|nr:AAA family ATPase [Cytophagales bacterium]